MQRIFIFLYSLFACILIMNPLTAIAPQDKQDVKNDLRILATVAKSFNDLLSCGCNCIPADFVAFLRMEY